MPEFHGDLFSRHAGPSEAYVFVAVDERRERVMSDDIFSSMQQKTARKEAWRPKCAAPRLVYDSALFFETFMHVYVRKISTNKYVQRKKQKENPLGGQVFLGKRVVIIFGLFDGLRSVGTRFRTSANPRPCIKKVIMSPSFTVRMGEDVKPKRSTF